MKSVFFSDSISVFDWKLTLYTVLGLHGVMKIKLGLSSWSTRHLPDGYGPVCQSRINCRMGHKGHVRVRFALANGRGSLVKVSITGTEPTGMASGMSSSRYSPLTGFCERRESAGHPFSVMSWIESWSVLMTRNKANEHLTLLRCTERSQPCLGSGSSFRVLRRTGSGAMMGPVGLESICCTRTHSSLGLEHRLFITGCFVSFYCILSDI